MAGNIYQTTRCYIPEDRNLGIWIINYYYNLWRKQLTVVLNINITLNLYEKIFSGQYCEISYGIFVAGLRCQDVQQSSLESEKIARQE
jgi:hypothetical protein